MLFLYPKEKKSYFHFYKKKISDIVDLGRGQVEDNWKSMKWVWIRGNEDRGMGTANGGRAFTERKSLGFRWTRDGGDKDEYKN